MPHVSSDQPHAVEIERLFLAADRHLSKSDRDVRRCLMENAASALACGDPAALRTLARFADAIGIELGPREAFMGTIRNAAALVVR